MAFSAYISYLVHLGSSRLRPRIIMPACAIMFLMIVCGVVPSNSMRTSDGSVASSMTCANLPLTSGGRTSDMDRAPHCFAAYEGEFGTGLAGKASRSGPRSSLQRDFEPQFTAKCCGDCISQVPQKNWNGDRVKICKPANWAERSRSCGPGPRKLRCPSDFGAPESQQIEARPGGN